MAVNLFLVALAPVLICLFYVYVRDKYEKEPINLLTVGVIVGFIGTFPIIQTETFVLGLMPICGMTIEALYDSFIVAALVEEGFKFVLLFFLTWWNRNFNEWFDGIVYSVYISLGFAWLENILYVFNPDLGGMTTALARSVFAVPGHGFFGVMMGYYFALAKFEPEKRVRYLVLAFLSAWFVHGMYDFILTLHQFYVFVLFVPFFVMMCRNGLKKMDEHVKRSPFKP